LGTTIGIPQAVAAVLPPANAASTLVNSTAVAQQFDEGLGTPGSDARQSKQQSVILQDLRVRAEVIGFGSCSVADVRGGREGCRP
jgi:filamentous hemagglutinin